MSEQLDLTQTSLEGIVNYDADSIAIEEELGTTLSFSAAIQPTQKIIRLFKQLSQPQLEELPTIELQTIRAQADNFFKVLQSIADFSPEKPEHNTKRRKQLISQVEDYYQRAFTKIFPLISYLNSRATDLTDLENNARATIQSV